MGRIVTSVTVGNIIEAGRDALVDTGAYCLTLPAAWKTRLGLLPMSRVVEAELADHRIIPGEVCGPVRRDRRRGSSWTWSQRTDDTNR